ncbi:PQQ-dependent sugar dehydrogenase [Arcobacteraceae bacterium]|nr:PQQ-dependent sugar dehydrogenase [Arcobacteraceae bacterium]
MNKISKIIIATFIIFSSLNAKNVQYKVEEVVSNLNVPWGMAFLDEKNMIFTQKNGWVLVLNVETKELTPIANQPKVYHYRQGGLLDVQVSPNYKKDGWIYFTYVKKQNGMGVTTLSRAKLQHNMLNSWEELLVTKSATRTGAHFGSRITFDEEGHLYFGVGDRGYRPNGQDINTHAGTIMRLNLDGSIPQDNPFVGKDGLDEIYSYGHRNPQGLFYDKVSKKLYEIEHGPRGGDEINLIEKGKNYGWATISYGKEYSSNKAVGIGTHKKGMEQPIKVYIPSIAPSSLIVYSGKVFKQWKGNLFSGALVLRHLNRIVVDKDSKAIDEERLLKNLDERIRNVVEGPNGWLYISTDSGRILRLKP